MASPIPPLNVSPNTDINMNDSCNCCWGRKPKKIKEKPQLQRQDAFSQSVVDIAQLTKNLGTRDADEVYDLHMSVNIQRKSRDLTHESTDSTKESS